jgi:hypothetical protein
VPEEAESVRRFLADEEVGEDEQWMSDWLDHVRQGTAAGRRYARIRVVNVPLTESSLFAIYVARKTTDAGEDIRYLEHGTPSIEELPHYDYWLFDSNQLVRMHFDNDGRPLDHELIDDPAEVVRHNFWRDLAWHHAIPREDFAVAHHVRRY